MKCFVDREGREKEVKLAEQGLITVCLFGGAHWEHIIITIVKKKGHHYHFLLCQDEIALFIIITTKKYPSGGNSALSPWISPTSSSTTSSRNRTSIKWLVAWEERKGKNNGACSSLFLLSFSFQLSLLFQKNKNLFSHSPSQPLSFVKYNTVVEVDIREAEISRKLKKETDIIRQVAAVDTAPLANQDGNSGESGAEWSYMFSFLVYGFLFYSKEKQCHQHSYGIFTFLRVVQLARKG